MQRFGKKNETEELHVRWSIDVTVSFSTVARCCHQVDLSSRGHAVTHSIEVFIFICPHFVVETLRGPSGNQTWLTGNPRIKLEVLMGIISKPFKWVPNLMVLDDWILSCWKSNFCRSPMLLVLWLLQTLILVEKTNIVGWGWVLMLHILLKCLILTHAISRFPNRRCSNCARWSLTDKLGQLYAGGSTVTVDVDAGTVVFLGLRGLQLSLLSCWSKWCLAIEIMWVKQCHKPSTSHRHK